MKVDLQSYKCLEKVTFTNIKGPLSKTFKILKVLFHAVILAKLKCK